MGASERLNLQNLKLELENILKDRFGYSSFRPGQFEIIEAIILKKNILAVMPTGAGKSLCYQLPAIYSDSKTIVISPLVALMDDQTISLKEAGLRTAHNRRFRLHGGASTGPRTGATAYRRRLENVRRTYLTLSCLFNCCPRNIVSFQQIHFWIETSARSCRCGDFSLS